MNKQLRIAAIAAAIVVMVGAVWAGLAFMDNDNGSTVMVQADNSAYKMKPDNAGGMDIPHQDKMVFNSASETRSGQIERIMPPPEQPAIDAPAQPLMASEPGPTSQTQAAMDMQPATAGAPEAKQVVQDDVAALGRVVQPATAAAPEVKAVENSAAAAFDMDKPSNSYTNKTVTREVITPPAAKPAEPASAGLAANMNEQSPVVEAVEETAPVAAAPEKPAQPKANMAMEPMASEGKKASSGGAGRFQLASFTDRASAEKALPTFSKKFGSALQGSDLNVVEGSAKGKKVYRIQGDASSASSVCASVKSAGGSCMVIR